MNLNMAKKTCEKVIEKISEIYVGEQLLITKLLAVALANGHVLFEDNPGLGKTLLAKTFSFTIGCNFSRIQFTPDILPADILGTKVWKPKDNSFELLKGPVFTNVLLADEINRAPPKTQSALLEAMEERQVTIEGETHVIQEPFFVLATQNPIEREGTYPLPEAQVDRFLLRLSTGYPKTLDEEKRILERRIQWKKDDPTKNLTPAISNAEFRSCQAIAENDVYVDDVILKYIAEIIRRTRQDQQVEVGVSPRGGLALLKASRALALINGRDFVVPDDIKSFAVDALAHRLILKVERILERTDEKAVIMRVVESVPVPKEFERK